MGTTKQKSRVFAKDKEKGIKAYHYGKHRFTKEVSKRGRKEQRNYKIDKKQ